MRDGATVAADVEQLGPEVERLHQPDDVGGELRWDWVPGYYTRIMLLQHMYIIEYCIE